MVIINRLEEGWEQGLSPREADDDWVFDNEERARPSPYGTFLDLRWEPRVALFEEIYHEPYDGGSTMGHTTELELLGRALEDMDGLRDGIKEFYLHFVDDGLLDNELAAARLAERGGEQ
ncbi:hypothetical protein QBC46DRAFT_397587 [Diplogelasinospora grovesii]|uniref:Uncharacterized protein n=1 Tax=Diplogelasinospora grovesii TaxID=303347 RepID=A0AAN6MZG8_9PEZI|nr:hypothetical protein QBC46DRAFT_397587 [Diplogelasinospora grovesii]